VCFSVCGKERQRHKLSMLRDLLLSHPPHTVLITVTSPLMWQRSIRSPYSSPLAVNKDSKYWICLSVRNLTRGLWTRIFNVTKTTLETIYFRACLRTRIRIVFNKRVRMCIYISRDNQWFHYLIPTDALPSLQVTVLTILHEIVLAEF
jgi:hypothetical protein